MEFLVNHFSHSLWENSISYFSTNLVVFYLVLIYGYWYYVNVDEIFDRKSFMHVLCMAGINNNDGITFDGVGEVPFALMSHVET